MYKSNYIKLVFAVLAAIVPILLFCAVVFIPTSWNVEADRNIVCQVELANIRSALMVYHHDYGHFPEGTNKDISAALRGDNVKGYIYIKGFIFSASEQSLLDVWRRPYHIDGSRHKVLICSSGENGIRGDGDDLRIECSPTNRADSK